MKTWTKDQWLNHSWAGKERIAHERKQPKKTWQKRDREIESLREKEIWEILIHPSFLYIHFIYIQDEYKMINEIVNKKWLKRKRICLTAF